jgi:Acetyltransferases, including N-acetylases of ribosomal proteins
LSQIRIADITRDNWFEAARLRVREDQTAVYPCPVVFWIAESKFETHYRPKAIYDDDRMIGFLVYGLDPDDGRYWLITFMIDEKHQGKGYAKHAIAAFLRYFKDNCEAGEIVLGHRPDNAAAAALYEKTGFRVTGEMIGGEVIRCYSFK